MDGHDAPRPSAGTLVGVEEIRARAWQSEVRAWAATVSTPGRGQASGRSAARSAGRALRTRCHVGVPGGERVVLPDEAALAGLGAGTDSPTAPGLRADLVERALDGVEDLADVAVWVARAGPLGLGDVELAWHSAARRALARHGLDPGRFLVLSLTGWWHLGSGERREWGRLRPRARVACSPRPWDVAG
ncbi:hypothetical protein GCM10027596_16630 [Nocardioides korecus]